MVTDDSIKHIPTYNSIKCGVKLINLSVTFCYPLPRYEYSHIPSRQGTDTL